jgi:hypothetical protein
MPRTKSSRNDPLPPPEERLEQISCKIDLLIFFQYYDGYVTNGQIGFDPAVGPPGSMKHKKPMKILDHLTPGKFRGKGTKLSSLAKEFIKEGVTPPQDKRPQFDREISIDELVPRDTRTPMDKLSERANDTIALFIFFRYHDGYTTNGRIGFNPRAGNPGSVNHKRAFTFLNGVSESQFRDKGKAMGCLAKEFIEKDVAPSQELRPRFESNPPTTMLQAALAATY